MTKEVQEYFVPWVKGISMYVSEHIELAWRHPELHRMMSNENPFEPSQKVMEAIQNYGKKANRYPDQGTGVRSKLAEINGLDGPKNVIIGNGSSEVFDNIFRSFLEVGDEVIQHTPCFGIYKLRCNILGGKLVSVPMIYEHAALKFDVDAVLAAITDKTKIIVVANPNNPSGNFMPKEDFIKIAETGIPFIIDEAYIEFAGLGRSHVNLTKKYKNVLITRTLSKAYGLAGMRFGYVLGDEAVISQIAAALLPWNVGTIPMWAALAALEDVEGLAERVEFNNSEVEYIENALSVIPGLTIFHSAANYILFDGTGTGKAGDDLVAFAKEKGLILRPQSHMYGLDGWFRLTLGTKEENRMAVETILEFYA
ncbi:MAG: histidinol-phosphate aminotransferase family protein [Chloroflexi bacterium]|nr:histidinol-phosphate aminotransferase family protein [Chloroflexota bacterium]MBL6960918.1 histidinol-phosphate aminotransferase family protein [Anaerolineales bacterium]